MYRVVVRLQNKGEVVDVIVRLCVINFFCSNTEKMVKIGVYLPKSSQN